ncbi:MAG: 50S ribosomal protein P1 [Candidatus Thermoplasmatota archaeon]|jgi:large subunit ribosomal protein L12|nr:50S ribosomal protein P1 [Candidatus Sysuiplasma jiujiangense]MBX8639299.1 50S ribosomal protein P1 [Candidatus Sysuiplasma jiujiangense]MBX8642945.1 50S ribosomal protein P1 [Candidatus Sysuiplasma jiujiangense]MCL5252610.1 50S ribosomal protein P1 [Candidatus Thermoplasmatota archaeon]
MEYIYGALLLHSAGKEINEESVSNIIKAAGVEPDPARVKALTASLSGINIEEAIKSAAVSSAPAPQQAHAPQEKKEEKKKEEKKEEAVSEEEAAAGLGALFG